MPNEPMTDEPEIAHLPIRQKSVANRYIRHGSATTHSAECWSFGPRHYECAVMEIHSLAALLDESRTMLDAAADEIERLRAENAAIREVADEAELNREGVKAAHAALKSAERERDELRRRISEADEAAAEAERAMLALRAAIDAAPVVKVRGKIGELATIVVSHSLVGKRVRLVVEDEPTSPMNP